MELLIIYILLLDGLYQMLLLGSYLSDARSGVLTDTQEKLL